MNIAGFVARFEGQVTRTRRGAMVKCPSHADKSPSLSIAEGDDGKILLKCFAGCEPVEICAAVGLTLADLFPDSQRSPHDILRERIARQAKQAAIERQRQKDGARLDALREAEVLITRERNIDTSQWSDAQMDAALNRLADAYDLLDNEGQ